MERTGRIKALTAYQMAKRIREREDNIYDKRIIENILNMYMDECHKALLDGERVQISKVCTIIPEVKVRVGNFNLPRCSQRPRSKLTGHQTCNAASCGVFDPRGSRQMSASSHLARCSQE